jgi:hypothetical protein
MGRIGVKAWIYKGEILPEVKTEEVEVAAPEPVVVAEVSPPAVVAEAKPVQAPAVVEEKPVVPVIAEAVPAPVPAEGVEVEKKPARPRRRVTKEAGVASGGDTAQPAPEAEKKPAPRPRASTRKVAPKTETTGEAQAPAETEEGHAAT